MFPYCLLGPLGPPGFATWRGLDCWLLDMIVSEGYQMPSFSRTCHTFQPSILGKFEDIIHFKTNQECQQQEQLPVSLACVFVCLWVALKKFKTIATIQSMYMSVFSLYFVMFYIFNEDQTSWGAVSFVI